MKADQREATKEKIDPKVLKAASILVIGALAPLLDTTMVNVSLHTIAAEMGASLADVQWITTGYVLAMGLSVPLSGWATTRFGCKRTYIASIAIFLVGSVLAMLSWNIQSLIAFAVIQGVGAGLLMPTLQTELVQISGGAQLGKGHVPRQHTRVAGADSRSRPGRGHRQQPELAGDLSHQHPPVHRDDPARSQMATHRRARDEEGAS